MTSNVPSATLPGHDLGGGHRVAALEYGDLIWHNGICRSWHVIDVTTGERHHITAGATDDLEHLTVAGSIMCVCPERSGHHGYIANGRWRDA